MMLRIGLELADRLVAGLPASVAYALAELAGRTWHRLAGERRRLVAANLARVCAASDRPTTGPAFRRLVRQAFVEHARYYLELLRGPHYRLDRIDEWVVAEDWERWRPIFESGVVVASAHLGNFEPFGSFLAAHGIRAVVPIEEIRPRELFEFLRARRGTGRGLEMVPLSRSRRRLLAAAREGRVVALIADRDITGSGVPVTLFGHPATLPSGPAALALAAGRPLLVARCLRTGREQFHGRAWQIDPPAATDHDAGVAALTAEVARRLEQAIAEAPEQWWGAFQPIWRDIPATSPAARAAEAAARS